MFTLLPKEQAHVTIVIATKKKKKLFFFPLGIASGLYLGIDSCSVSAERGACVLILCYLCDRPPLVVAMLVAMLYR